MIASIEVVSKTGEILGKLDVNVQCEAGVVVVQSPPVVPIVIGGEVGKILAYFPDIDMSVELNSVNALGHAVSPGSTVTLELPGNVLAWMTRG